MERSSLARWLRAQAWMVFVVLVILSLGLYSGSNSYNRKILTKGYSVKTPAPGYRLQEVTVKVDPERVLTDKTFVGVSRDDPALMAYIRRRLLVHPSTQPYNLSRPKVEHYSQYGQTKYANDRFLRNMKGGFFVEVGAVDGEFLSNTLFLEKSLGWTGLLIEANPLTYQQLLYKHRKAYSINAALSHTNISSEISFRTTGNRGVLGHIDKNWTRGIKVKAVPFWSILQAINVTVIDFFSLDIEGSEVKVLRTVPWDKVRIRLMCIECNNLSEGKNTLVKLLTSRGYFYIGMRGIDCWFGWPSLLMENLKGLWI